MDTGPKELTLSDFQTPPAQNAGELTLADFQSQPQSPPPAKELSLTDFGTPPVASAQDSAPLLPWQSIPGIAPGIVPGIASILNSTPAKNFVKWMKAVPGRMKNFAQEKEMERENAVKAQQAKFGAVGQMLYSTPVAPCLTPEMTVEALKTLASKGKMAWEGTMLNVPKFKAQMAESDIKDLINKIGPNAPNTEQQAKLNSLRASATQNWALAEDERKRRQLSVQNFGKWMDSITVPSTPVAKAVGEMVPFAAQAYLAPQTIAPEMGLNTFTRGQLNNPVQEQTTGQQVKEAALGIGFGKLMQAGIPGVPVSRALQNLGMEPVPANLIGMVPTSISNVLAGHQLERWLTTPHGETPASPTASDFFRDYATQLGLGAGHLGQRLAEPAGAPLLTEPTAPVPVGRKALETPLTPGEVNPRATETAPLPGPSVVQGPAMAPAIQAGSLQTIFPGIKPKVTAADIPSGSEFKLAGAYAPVSKAGVNTVGKMEVEGTSPVTRVQPSPLEGMPGAYGLAPVRVEAGVPTPKATLSEHEAEMAMVKQQRENDRSVLFNGPVAETNDIAPEHHAEADRILEARNIVTVSERKALEAERNILQIEIKNRQRALDGKAPIDVPESLLQQAKNRLAPDDPLRELAASEPSHPDSQRALQVAQEQQQALAAEYAASTPGGEGDITHASRVALKQKPEEPTFGAKVREFFGGAPTDQEQTGIPGMGKRPKQKNEYSKSRLYETVDGPAGPTVVYKGEPGDTAYDIVGRSGKIQEADITARRESTKDEITRATSQVEVETPGEIDPETGEAGPSSTHIELDPSQAVHFSRNAVASAAKARESARDAVRGRKVMDDLKANPNLYSEDGKPEGPEKSEWRPVSELPLTKQVKGRLGEKSFVRADAAQTLIEYFGQSHAKEASFFSGLDRAARKWTERGLLTNIFAHFPNQFAHGLGALAGEGLSPQEATNALAHAYRQGQNPNSEYINRAKAAGVKQMSEGRVLGENSNMSAHEAATVGMEKALGHEPGTMGEAEGNSIKRAFKALNQKTVWQIDDAIRNTLFYQKIASGMTPELAAKYANQNYVGYHTDTNLFELNPNRSPRDAREMAKKGLNEIYRHLVTGKGETGKGLPGAGATLARTLVSPLFHTFRTNSAELLGREISEAGKGVSEGNLKGLGKLANTAMVGSAVGGVVGQTLSDALLSEDEKKRGKEYHMRMGGPFHWYDTAEKMVGGRANKYQTAAAIATPNPLFKQLIGKAMFGTDVSTGRRAPASSLAELGDTVLSSVLPTGDIARNALQGQGNARDVVASFLMGKNAPNAAAQIMMAHPDKLAASTPDYEQSRANYRLISQLRDLEPGSAEYSNTIRKAVDDQILTKRQIENATKRSGQTELEHMRALAKIAEPDAIVAAADTYANTSPEIARVLYAEAQKKLGSESKKFSGARNLKLIGKIQQIENKKILLH